MVNNYSAVGAWNILPNSSIICSSYGSDLEPAASEYEENGCRALLVYCKSEAESKSRISCADYGQRFSYQQSAPGLHCGLALHLRRDILDHQNLPMQVRTLASTQPDPLHNCIDNPYSVGELRTIILCACFPIMPKSLQLITAKPQTNPPTTNPPMPTATASPTTTADAATNSPTQ